jgi:hypothetical protein
MSPVIAYVSAMARRRVVALTSLVLTISASAVALATGVGARTRVPCGPAAAHTLASSAHARVYSARGAAFGCAVGGNGAFRLGVTTHCIGSDLVGPIAVAGQIAAYASERCGIDTGSTEVLVRNLRTGKRLSASPAVASPGPESFASVDSLVARPDGAAAWIAQASSLGNHQKNVELRRVDARGQSLLDSGPAIAPRSLRLRGSTLTWRHGGQPRSSTLS